MCYISRRIFPCCGRENWYSTPIPQQCTGTPRCPSTDCIILRPRATVLKVGRCWRCILGDMEKGVRAGVSDRVLREAQRLGEENSRGGGGVGKKRGRKGGKKRKRGVEEDDGISLGEDSGGIVQGMRDERPFAKKRRGLSGQSRSVRANNGAPPTQMPYTPAKTPEIPSEALYSWSNELRNLATIQVAETHLPASQVPSDAPLQSPPSLSRHLDEQNLTHNAKFSPDTTIDPNLLVNWKRENSNFAFGTDLYPELAIDPRLLMNWNDLKTFDTSLPENRNQVLFSADTNINWSMDQNTAFDQQDASWLLNPDNESYWQNMQFTGGWPDVTLDQRASGVADDGDINIGIDKKTAVAVDVDANVVVGPASIPFGDPMWFPSDLGIFGDLVQWPETDAAELDERSRQELEELLFGHPK